MRAQRPYRGFTLIELMVVVTLIGLLSTIAIPYYQKMSARAYRAELQMVLPKVRQHFVNQYENTGKYGDGTDFTSAWNPAPSDAPLGQPAVWKTALSGWSDVPFSADGVVRMRYRYSFAEGGTKLVLQACGYFPGLGAGDATCGVSGANFSYSETLVGTAPMDENQPVELPSF